MNLDDMTIGDAKKLATMFGSQQPEQPNPHIGKFVIVRTRDAGVHCGILKSASGRGCELTDARRIWRWRGANTLNELANKGANETEYTRISEPVSSVVLTENCEVILCTQAAQDNLVKSRWL